MYLFLVILTLGAVGVIAFFQRNTFGKNPTGRRKQRIINLSHYKNGSFQNLEETSVMRPEASYINMIVNSFNKPASVKPPQILPSDKTDLNTLKAEMPTIVWFGHSSYFIQSKNSTILVDPVMRGNASPVSFLVKPFKGTDVYSIEDLPAIDVVLLTHDHYDHLHYESIKKLAHTARQFCVSLGVGEHLEYWGVPPEKITELDWWETKTYAGEIKFTAVPARHFSGRSFKRGQTLWSGFALNIHGHRLLLGGDSGYGDHFKKIGDKLGPFEVAILECGQYGKDWPLIHMLPEETVQAAKDVNAKMLMPVHWAKFDLAFHDWDDPIKRVVIKANELGQPITTPMIGEPVIVGSSYPNKTWWKLDA